MAVYFRCDGIATDDADRVVRSRDLKDGTCRMHFGNFAFDVLLRRRGRVKRQRVLREWPPRSSPTKGLEGVNHLLRRSVFL
jgi:hypothetical protein